jgi:hypothetical protein
MTASEHGSGWHLVDRVDGEAMSLATCFRRKYMMCLHLCLEVKQLFHPSLVNNQKENATGNRDVQLSLVLTCSQAESSLTESSELT